jgi:hypothetical protein
MTTVLFIFDVSSMYMLQTGPKVCRFIPGQGDGFLEAIKINSTPSSGGEVKLPALCRKILQHVNNNFKV